MRALNIALTVMLVIVTLAFFVNDERHSTTIGDLKDKISAEQTIINNLTRDNRIISNEVDSLKELSFSLQGVLDMYKDSIVDLHKQHIIIYNEVSALSDSASYEYFLNYLRAK